MAVKLILVVVLALFGIIRFITNTNHKLQGKKFIEGLENDPEHLESYIQELTSLSGKQRTNTNKLDRIDTILVGVKRQMDGLSILKILKISDLSYLVLTRIILHDHIPGTSRKDEVIHDLHYLISFNPENEELKLNSDYHSTLEDKNLRFDFARAFIEQYNQI
ncbi:hypothetical protein [Emticicia fontis]